MEHFLSLASGGPPGMLEVMKHVSAMASGALVGFLLGLTGGGGSILAVPLMLYVSGLTDAHIAVGTGALVVSVSAFFNLLSHARSGHVSWPAAALFAVTGVAGAAVGSTIGKHVNGQELIAFFALAMIVIAVMMQRPRRVLEGGMPRLSRTVVRRLGGTGFGVGALAGFFGIGGGFLVVPGLVFASRMATIDAIGSSLLSVGSFSLMTSLNYAISGFVIWKIAAEYILGGFIGGHLGGTLAKRLASNRMLLNRLFGGVLVVVASYMLIRTALPLAATSPTPFDPTPALRARQEATKIIANGRPVCADSRPGTAECRD
jgi:uncharacterized membrane protein YfcA